MSVADSKPIHIVPLRDRRVRELIDVPLSSLYEMARKSPPELPGIVRIGRRVMIDLVVFRAWARSASPAMHGSDATRDGHDDVEADAS